MAFHPSFYQEPQEFHTCRHYCLLNLPFIPWTGHVIEPPGDTCPAPLPPQGHMTSTPASPSGDGRRATAQVQKDNELESGGDFERQPLVSIETTELTLPPPHTYTETGLGCQGQGFRLPSCASHPHSRRMPRVSPRGHRNDLAAPGLSFSYSRDLPVGEIGECGCK